MKFPVFQQGDKDLHTGVLIPDNLIGQPKGMKRVLEERGLLQLGLKEQCGKSTQARVRNSVNLFTHKSNAD